MAHAGRAVCAAAGVAILLSAASAQSASPVRGGQAPRAPAYVADQYIVVLRDRVHRAQDVRAVARDVASRGRGRVRQVYKSGFTGFAVRLPRGGDAARLRQDPRVAFVRRDQVVRRADHVPTEIPTGVDRINAELNRVGRWANLRGRSPKAWGVAVLDTGVQLGHPDLNVVSDVSFVPDAPSGNDDHGHGTHVAGIIAARDNGTGVVGVAPGVPLFAVKVLNRDGVGSLSDLIAGIEWITQRASRIAVANMSLSTDNLVGFDWEDGDCGRVIGDPLHMAICASVEAGVVYVAAAGNHAGEVKGAIPAAYREVVTVSALADSDGTPNGTGPGTWAGGDDTFAGFSNFGPGVDLIAPGVDILSVCPDGYCLMSGTSMAAPHVTGAVALWMRVTRRPATRASGMDSSPTSPKTSATSTATPTAWPSRRSMQTGSGARARDRASAARRPDRRGARVRSRGACDASAPPRMTCSTAGRA
jgi:subtilisin